MDSVNRAIFISMGLLSFVLLATTAHARLNLPQSKEVTTLPGNLVASIRASVEPSSASSAELPPPIQANVLRALPQDFRAACPSLIESWGDVARRTDEWQVRVLARKGDQLWLAFRCASRASEYEKDYDERPAVLYLAAGKLEFVPLGPDAENDSTLYHVDFSGLLELEGAHGVVLKVTEPAGNPCCDGPESRSGETWRIFAETPLGVVELLSVTTARNDSSHSDDPDVDSETTYRAQVTLDHDPQSRATAVTVAFHEEVKDITYEGEKANAHIVSQRSGRSRYRWVPGSMHFAESK